MVIKVSDNDNFSSKHHNEELTMDERQEFITTIKNLTQSLSNLEVLNPYYSRTSQSLLGAS